MVFKRIACTSPIVVPPLPSLGPLGNLCPFPSFLIGAKLPQPAPCPSLQGHAEIPEAYHATNGTKISAPPHPFPEHPLKKFTLLVSKPWQIRRFLTTDPKNCAWKKSCAEPAFQPCVFFASLL